MGVACTGEVTFRTTLLRESRFTVLEDSQLDPVVARGGTHLADFLARQERDPAMAAALAAMRRRVAQQRSQQAGGPPSLVTLRQHAGLSQAQLAANMQTSQPNVARWEKDPEQMTARTIRRMAAALGVREQDIHDAMPSDTQTQQVEHADHS